MSYLVLVRHGKSEWNEKGLWTGWTDIPLAPSGFEEAKKTGDELKDIPIDLAYTSSLVRAKQTLDVILREMNITTIPIESDKALNERDYGDYTGKNKWEVEKEVGKDEFQHIRRSWDATPPNGESLKMVYERVMPYYKEKIEPQLENGKNVLISAHGNSLRALVKYLEGISDAKIADLEIGTGEAYIYQIDNQGKVIDKEIRGKNPETGKI